MSSRSALFSGTLCALLAGAVPAHAALQDGLLVTGIGVSLALAIAGFVAGFLALGLQRRAASEQRRLIAMVERSLADQALRSETDLRALVDMAAAARQEIETLPGRLDAGDTADEAAPEDEPAANVIRLTDEVKKAARQSESAGGDAAAQAADDTETALCEGRFDLALEPVLSISDSRAVGFSVHAAVGAQDTFISRMTHEPRPGCRLAFEASMMRQAAAVARRQLGDSAADMPLYVPVSASLLQNEDAVGNVATLYRNEPDLALSLIPVVPVHLMIGANRKCGPALERLRFAGAQFAVEGWLGGEESLAKLSAFGVHCVRLSANRLLGRDKLRPRDLDAESIISACAEKEFLLVAMDVTTDEEAVSLIDIGIDRMSGKRFNGPKRLKATPPHGKGVIAGG